MPSSEEAFTKLSDVVFTEASAPRVGHIPEPRVHSLQCTQISKQACSSYFPLQSIHKIFSPSAFPFLLTLHGRIFQRPTFAMKVSFTVFTTITLLAFETYAAPRTRTSTLTIIPPPTSTFNITHTGYPTATGTGTGLYGYTNYTLHKTLHYPTTTITRQSFSTVYLPPNATAAFNGSAPQTLAVRDWPSYVHFPSLHFIPMPPLPATPLAITLPLASQLRLPMLQDYRHCHVF